MALASGVALAAWALVIASLPLVCVAAVLESREEAREKAGACQGPTDTGAAIGTDVGAGTGPGIGVGVELGASAGTDTGIGAKTAAHGAGIDTRVGVCASTVQDK
eukprot:CAMPEP_0119360702 /NCGR_PEP_ID=MMETSP1334-20130426/8226_1 /TAXON_ID=127549 /ORGANISM="Calcidiscus leptoporus, Strain RCC1130" /LENGTH=104 /DNA_ID=CAMNT_0007375581 /DNA_START=310 /DNA_END=623 /DNA_ORIENTATION=-